MNGCYFNINLIVNIDIENNLTEILDANYLVRGFNIPDDGEHRPWRDCIDEEVGLLDSQLFELSTLNEEEFRGKPGIYEMYGKGVLEYHSCEGPDGVEYDSDFGIEDIIYQDITYWYDNLV